MSMGISEQRQFLDIICLMMKLEKITGTHRTYFVHVQMFQVNFILLL